MFPEFSQNVPKAVHCGKTVGTLQMCHPGTFSAHHSGSFQILLAGDITITLIYYLIRTLWSHDLEHCKHTDQFFLNEPLGNIVGTFFGKILGFPMGYLMGTLQSHDLEHCECTGHFLCWEHCNEIGLGNSECDCNVPDGFLVGTLSISL